MRKGDEEKAEKIAARLSKRYAVAGEVGLNSMSY